MEWSARSVVWPSAGERGLRTEIVSSSEFQQSCSEDRALVRRMLVGDAAAFERFTRDYLPLLYRFAVRRLRGDGELAREVVQATVCKAIAALAGFRGEAPLSTWLCACCRNEIAGHFRRGAREVELDAEPRSRAALALEAPAADGPEHVTMQRERAALVHELLDELPPDYGRALEWKYIDDLPVVEIARRLERAPKAAESLLTRARQAFRRGFLERVARTAAGEEEPRP